MHNNSTTLQASQLRQSPLLASLDNAQLDYLIRSSRVISLRAGERIVAQGQNASTFYMVMSGQIKKYRISADGNERVIDIIQAGQIFAESLLFFSNARYPFFAETLGKTRLIAFNSEAFIDILQQSTATCFMLMNMMGEKIIQYLEQVDGLTLQNASSRLINFLLKQVPDDHPRQTPFTFRLTAPKCVIASWLSVQPETLSRQLHTLKSRDLIEVTGNRITINDIEQLSQQPFNADTVNALTNAQPCSTASPKSPQAYTLQTA